MTAEIKPNSGGFLIDFIQSFHPFCDGTYFTPPEVAEFIKDIDDLAAKIHKGEV